MIGNMVIVFLQVQQFLWVKVFLIGIMNYLFIYEYKKRVQFFKDIFNNMFFVDVYFEQILVKFG